MSFVFFYKEKYKAIKFRIINQPDSFEANTKKTNINTFFPLKSRRNIFNFSS